MNIYDHFSSKDVVDSEIDISCIGAFDGLHLGHIELIKSTFEYSKNFQIITFDTLPKIFFNKKLKPILSNTMRNNILKSFNPSNVVYLEFSKVNKISSEEFLDLLVKNLKTKKILVGKDFKFGKDRSGDVQTLINFFGDENVIILDDFFIENEKVSSTKIRHYLDEGNIGKVNAFLGREYEIAGIVVKGMRLGSKIGFPTANIKLEHEIYFPRLGVYEIECDLNNDVYKGIVNIGYAPTVVDRKVLKVEAHLFNFDQDIYGEEIKIRLQRFIRPEKKFQSIEQLLEQIKADIDSIKNK